MTEKYYKASGTNIVGCWPIKLVEKFVVFEEYYKWIIQKTDKDNHFVLDGHFKQ